MEINKEFSIIQKAFNEGIIDEDTFLKAQRVYMDNAENRKLKRVGKPYGSASQEEHKTDKPSKEGDESGASSKSVEEHAREASQEALESATKSGNEELRIAAKKELDRREKEETPKEEGEKEDMTSKKEPAKDDHDTKIKELEDRIRELRGADIDYSDEKALDDNAKQVKEAMEERKKLVSERDSFRKVPFEEYMKGFKDLSGDDNKEEANKYYEKEVKGVESYLKDNDNERISINTYTGNGHKAIRNYLSDPENYDQDKVGSSMDSETIKEVSNDLSTFILNNKIKDDIVLNRRIKGEGLKFFQSFEKGDIYEDKSFSSTSLGEMTHFGEYNISILAKKGSSVANVDNVGELEYLIDKGSKFRVLDKTDEGMIVELL